MDDKLKNRLGGDRIASRQIDELIGLARGIAADGTINQAEVEFLQKWLAANASISDQAVVHTLYQRVNEILEDNIVDPDEAAALLDALNCFSRRDFELGEILKPTSLPLSDPAPDLVFRGLNYCFTGTFNYGQRKYCEEAVVKLGGWCGGLNMQTNVLVIGAYATESWKHSSFGNKILKACELRDAGARIAIVAEEHWVKYL